MTNLTEDDTDELDVSASLLPITHVADVPPPFQCLSVTVEHGHSCVQPLPSPTVSATTTTPSANSSMPKPPCPLKHRV